MEQVREQKGAGQKIKDRAEQEKSRMKHGRGRMGGYRSRRDEKGSGDGIKKVIRRCGSYLRLSAVLAAVVMTAFFTPQIIFRIQDSVLYRRTELGQREPMDVEALSGSYETDTHRRMMSFAEGLALGDSFYVTSKNLATEENGEELNEYLYSEVLYQGMGEWMMGQGLLPVDLYTLKYETVVSQWKQYVVYSDNYAKGVNFILWYVELDCVEDITVKLLADAKTGTLYALKVQGCKWAESSDYVQIKCWEAFEPERLMELWLLAAAQFGVLSTDEDLQRLVTQALGTDAVTIWPESEADLLQGGMWPEDGNGQVRWEEAYEEIIINMDAGQREKAYAAITTYIEEKIEADREGRSVRLLLPYEAASLEIFMEIGELQTEVDGFSYEYPDITIGVRQLYEMIPEFL